MNSVKTNRTTKTRWSISEVGPSLTTLAAAAVRGVLKLAALSVLLIAAGAAQGQPYSVLYNFCDPGLCPQSGVYPQGRLTPDGQGDFYGVTMGGGNYDAGLVFELLPDGSENPIYSFGPGPDGIVPFLSYVIFDGEGNLYGTASAGGANSTGVVYELIAGESGWSPKVLYNFTSTPDGENPYSGLVMDSQGNLYGITHNGGTNGNGCVFELSPSGGGWTEQVIYNVAVGDSILAGLAIDAAGNLFGNTFHTVFELSNDGGWDSHLLHTFGSGKDGIDAQGVPVLDGSENIYGTTFSGGAHGEGTVYEVSPELNGKWKEKVLYPFKDNAKDGVGPVAGVLLYGGNIYGTTTGAGKYNYGTVFELTPTGKSSYKEAPPLWNFNGTTGDEALGSLILDTGNLLYGTTEKGGSGEGSGGDGVVFEVTP